MITLLACTHLSDNVFHTLTVLWENENVLTSNLLCFFTRLKWCPLVILLSLISKRKCWNQYFITIEYLKHFYLISLNLRVSSVVSPHSFSRSSYVRSISRGMSLVALLCIFASISMSFLRYGLLACIQYSKWGLTIALYRRTIKLFSLYVIILRIIPRIWLPLDAAILRCSETFMLAFIDAPTYFTFTILLRIVPPIL